MARERRITAHFSNGRRYFENSIGNRRNAGKIEGTAVSQQDDYRFAGPFHGVQEVLLDFRKGNGGTGSIFTAPSALLSETKQNYIRTGCCRYSLGKACRIVTFEIAAFGIKYFRLACKRLLQTVIYAYHILSATSAAP